MRELIEKELTTCTQCKQDCVLPPGVYYRGEPYCKPCAIRLRKRDFTEEYVSPLMDLVEQELEEALEHVTYESL